MLYGLFGFWIRREACKMAAIAMQGEFNDDAICPRLWSLTVFFENYMRDGASGTSEDFGPKEPVQLASASGGSAA